MSVARAFGKTLLLLDFDVTITNNQNAQSNVTSTQIGTYVATRVAINGYYAQ